MFDKLNIVKNKGYFPDAILDIGAHKGGWTLDMQRIYNDCPYFLFEGVDYDELKDLNNNKNIQVFNVILNNKIDVVNWYQLKSSGDSMFKERTNIFDNCEIIQRETIDLNTVVSKNNLLENSKNIFIKIDCQGAEIPILKGALNILERTDFILLEIPLFGQYNDGVASFLEHITFMDSIGFNSYDILENHMINGFNMQIDMLFINKKHEFNTLVNKQLLL